MVLMTYALQNGEVSFVAPFRLTALVWAALIAWVVFAEVLTVMDFLGITLVAVALLLLSKAAGPSTPNQPV